MRCGCLTCVLRRLVAFIKMNDKPDSPDCRHADMFMLGEISPPLLGAGLQD